MLYFKQFYFIVTTVSVVGYGDQIPGADGYQDTFLLTVTILLGILSFSYLTGQVDSFIRG